MLFKFLNQKEFADKRESIRALLREFPVDNPEMLYISLNEAANNVFNHGYKENNSDYKPLEIEIYLDNDELIIKVRQEGVGYQNDGLKDATEKDNFNDLWKECGRGLFIINNCTDHFEFNNNGTELTMCKKLLKTEKFNCRKE